MIAESWTPVTVPVFLILGATAGRWVGVAHLLVGYTVLGLILALRPSSPAAEPSFRDLGRLLSL